MRRLQFEARREYILAQRDYIDLHARLVARVRNDVPRENHLAMMNAVHRLLREFAGVLGQLDRCCV